MPFDIFDPDMAYMDLPDPSETTSDATKPPAKEPKDEKIDGYLPNEHPWCIEFLDSLVQGKPSWLYYLGLVQVCGGEANLPDPIVETLNIWVEVGRTTATRCVRDEKARRHGVLHLMRSMAAELGFGCEAFPPVQANKVLMTMSLRKQSNNECDTPDSRPSRKHRKAAIQACARRARPPYESPRIRRPGVPRKRKAKDQRPQRQL
ncbi:hypothetical protein FALBO_10922 [Fusarium albosuccineum]|uniref:Uncharacterized protein n=1 Tax=Fusarium albosuccineum TaxID=1237068 RepID=A0A8H4P7N4_9HYPO|nr:hypothetical protein FALBO_10922 [Fusarium albosuccineum]